MTAAVMVCSSILSILAVLLLNKIVVARRHLSGPGTPHQLPDRGGFEGAGVPIGIFQRHRGRSVDLGFREAQVTQRAAGPDVAGELPECMRRIAGTQRARKASNGVGCCLGI